jgi:hypothetical protein
VRRSIVVAGAAVAVVGAVLLWRASSAPPRSDEDQIRALFEDAAKAAEERRVSDVVAAVSERFAGEGIDRRGVKQLVAAHVLRGEWVRVAIAGVRVAVDGGRASAIADAVFARGGARGKPLADLLTSEAAAHRFECALEREDAGWRVVSARWRSITIREALDGPPDPPAPTR